MDLRLSKSDLFQPIFVDFVSAQLGWHSQQGVTRHENVKHLANDSIVCKSNVKDLRVLVVDEVLEEEGVRILTLSDGDFEIHALIWRHTQGINQDQPLLNTVLALQDFDISVRHSPPDCDEGEKDLHELLQYHLQIHTCHVVPSVPPTLGKAIHVRHKPNVKRFLDEFKLWSIRYTPDASNKPGSSSQNPQQKQASMDEISTQIPSTSQPAHSDFTQSIIASHLGDAAATREAILEPNQQRGAQSQSRPARIRPVIYDGDADWAKVISRSRISTRDVNTPKAQMESMQWAPAPGTRNVVPALPKRDLDQMIDYVDNPDEYINLLDHVSDNGDDTPQPHQTRTIDKDDVEEREEHEDLVAYALQNRGREDEREGTPVTASQWPASPTQAARLGPEAIQVSPPQFSPLEDSSEGEEDDTIKDELPPDSDNDPIEQPVAGLKMNAQQPSSATWDEEDEDVRARKPNRLRHKAGSRQALLSQHDFGDNESGSDDGLPNDEEELRARLFTERDSPLKAQIYRKLKHVRESRAADQASSPIEDGEGGTGTTLPTRKDKDVGMSDSKVSTQLSPAGQTQQVSSPASTKLQVGRTPYSGMKQPRRPPTASRDPVVSASLPHRQLSTSPPPSSKTAPPTSSVVFSSSQSPGHSREHSPRVLVGTAVPAIAAISPESTPAPQSSYVRGSPQDAEAISPGLKRKRMQEHGQKSVQKKQRLVKPATQESFDLSQGLADYAGTQYNVDSMRAEFIAQRPQKMSLPAQVENDTEEDESQDKPEFEPDHDQVEGTADARIEKNDEDAMQFDGHNKPVAMHTSQNTGGQIAIESEEEDQQAIKMDIEVQTRLPSSIPSSVLHISGSRSSSTASPRLQELPIELSLYDKFTRAYPSWTGTEKDFDAQCKAIMSAKTMTVFLDDFVIRRKMHYRSYAFDCIDDNINPLPYEEWFDQVSEAPMFRLRVLDRGTITTYLASLNEVRAITSNTLILASRPALASPNRSALERDVTRYQKSIPAPAAPHGSRKTNRADSASMPSPPARGPSPTDQRSPAHLLLAAKKPSPLQRSSLVDRQSRAESPSLNKRPSLAHAAAPEDRFARADDRKMPSTAPVRHDFAHAASSQSIKPRPSANGIGSANKVGTPNVGIDAVQSGSKSRRSLPWNMPKDTPTSTPKNTPKKAPASVKGKEPGTAIEISDGEDSDDEEEANDDEATVNVRPKPSKPMPDMPNGRKTTTNGASRPAMQAQIATKSRDLRRTVSEAQLKPKAVTPAARNNETRRVASATQSRPKPATKPMGPVKRALLRDDEPVPPQPNVFAKYIRRSMA